MSTPKLRQPSKPVSEKPKLTLIKPTVEHQPLPEMDDSIKEMLREMNHRQKKRETGGETPDAA